MSAAATGSWGVRITRSLPWRDDHTIKETIKDRHSTVAENPYGEDRRFLKDHTHRRNRHALDRSHGLYRDCGLQPAARSVRREHGPTSDGAVKFGSLRHSSNCRTSTTNCRNSVAGSWRRRDATSRAHSRTIRYGDRSAADRGFAFKLSRLLPLSLQHRPGRTAMRRPQRIFTAGRICASLL
jgi:hypothetical protein